MRRVAGSLAPGERRLGKASPRRDTRDGASYISTGSARSMAAASLITGIKFEGFSFFGSDALETRSQEPCEQMNAPRRDFFFFSFPTPSLLF